MKKIQRSAQLLLIVFIFLWFVPYTEIEGQVRLVGTAVFPSLVLSAPDGKTYYFDKALFDEFVSYQNQTIKIKAKVKDVKMQLADKSRTLIQPTIYRASLLTDDSL